LVKDLNQAESAYDSILKLNLNDYLLRGKLLTYSLVWTVVVVNKLLENPALAVTVIQNLE